MIVIVIIIILFKECDIETVVAKVWVSGDIEGLPFESLLDFESKLFWKRCWEHVIA